MNCRTKEYLYDDVDQAIWGGLGVADRVPHSLGIIGDGGRDRPLATTQLILLYHLLATRPVEEPKDAARP